MNQRERQWEALNAASMWDVVVIGGGASGLGVAVHAAASGLKTALVEREDFAKGTSSKSTKLIHGGVRYLQQGNIKLVREALRERGLLMKNAPHLVHDMKFVIPTYTWWNRLYYGIGLKVYDRLAGKLGLGKSHFHSASEASSLLPGIESEGLQGGVSYHDGQFDDAHLALSLVQTALQSGATLVNYCAVTGLVKEGNTVRGVQLEDRIGGGSLTVNARFVVNATGAFSDEILRMDRPRHKPIIRLSQGVHLVVDRKFFPGETALLIPKTDDGRILFAVPWHGKVILGTTDTPIEQASSEPVPLDAEIDFILTHMQRFLSQAPTRADVLSAFAGIRPLVKMSDKKTSELARDHVVRIGRSGLISVMGGKWTTYRKMAADVLRKIESRSAGRVSLADTRMLRMVDAAHAPNPASIEGMTDEEVRSRVAWEVEHSLCMTVDDFLSRRTRQLLLDARVAIERAPFVAACMADLLGKDETWRKQQVKAFQSLALNYLPKKTDQPPLK